MQDAFRSESSISTSVIAFKNLVILIYTWTKFSDEIDDDFLVSEDEARSISVSKELRRKQVRFKSSPSIIVDKIKISRAGQVPAGSLHMFHV